MLLFAVVHLAIFVVLLAVIIGLELRDRPRRRREWASPPSKAAESPRTAHRRGQVDYAGPALAEGKLDDVDDLQVGRGAAARRLARDDQDVTLVEGECGGSFGGGGLATRRVWCWGRPGVCRRLLLRWSGGMDLKGLHAGSLILNWGMHEGDGDRSCYLPRKTSPIWEISMAQSNPPY
jgi:hypothetical protein